MDATPLHHGVLALSLGWFCLSIPQVTTADHHVIAIPPITHGDMGSSSHHPVFDFTNYLWNSEWYDTLLTNPNFLKAQQMAQRVWDVQTGNTVKKRIRQTSARENVTTRRPYHREFYKDMRRAP